MKLAYFSLAGLTAASSLTTDYQWHAWKKHYKVSFGTRMEEASRYNIFTEKREFVKNHNERAARGEETYVVKLNKFAAMTEDEFAAKYLNNKMSDPALKLGLEYNCEGQTFSNNGSVAPENLSYAPGRQGFAGDNRVTVVKDQGSCGSCWAFATSAVLEASMCASGAQNCDSWQGLSPQQLVDCLSNTKGNAVDLNPYDDGACNGGFITNGVRSIAMWGGQNNWVDYPYESGTTKTQGECRYVESSANLNIATSCGRLMTPSNENEMVDAINQLGPLGIGINASGPGFSLYDGGVYSNPRCSDRLNHAVLATGFGVLNGMDYFEIKNSWSADWGDHGYVNIARNSENMCGVASDTMWNIN